MAIYVYVCVSMRNDDLESDTYIQKHYFLTTSYGSAELKKNQISSMHRKFSEFSHFHSADVTFTKC